MNEEILLKKIYKEYEEENNVITPRSIIKISDLNKDTLDLVLHNLKEQGLIDIAFTLGNYEGIQNFIFGGITEKGKQKVKKN